MKIIFGNHLRIFSNSLEKSFENRFFNQFCEAQSGNLVQSSVEYEAKLYYYTSLPNTELLTQTKDIGMTKFLIQKARKICEEHL